MQMSPYFQIHDFIYFYFVLQSFFNYFSGVKAIEYNLGRYILVFTRQIKQYIIKQLLTPFNVNICCIKS